MEKHPNSNRSQLRVFRLAAALFVGSLVGTADAAPARALTREEAEGTLWAAECVATPGADSSCNQRALAASKPGGLLAETGYIVLLLDGRILSQSCPQGGLAARIRASGIFHGKGQAMTVFRLMAQCGGSWHVVNLPFSGALGSDVESGNE